MVKRELESRSTWSNSTGYNVYNTMTSKTIIKWFQMMKVAYLFLYSPPPTHTQKCYFLLDKVFVLAYIFSHDIIVMLFLFGFWGTACQKHLPIKCGKTTFTYEEVKKLGTSLNILVRAKSCSGWNADFIYSLFNPIFLLRIANNNEHTDYFFFKKSNWN